MSIYRLLKWIALIPFRTYQVNQPLHTFGDGDCWKIIKPHSLKPTVLAAGVGHRISFEEQLASELDADILLVDPTPTGIATISSLEGVIPNIEYQQVGLAAKDQVMAFSLPKNPEEGSFSLASDNNDTNVRFQCRTVDTLAASRSWNHIDILKMDIEGFEYEILESVSSWQTSVDQICVEIHVKNSSGTIHSVWDAVSLFWRLRRQGYAIIYNSAMDFTFARTDFTKRKNTVVR